MCSIHRAAYRDGAGTATLFWVTLKSTAIILGGSNLLRIHNVDYSEVSKLYNLNSLKNKKF